MTNRILIGSVAIILLVLIGLVVAFSRDNNQPAKESDTAQNTTPTQGTDLVQDTNNEYAVSYSENGFMPSALTVKKGSQVIFINDGSTQMWVASAPHPQHTDYPEFDAKRGYNPGESYTFTFDRVGNWKYHDHLDASKFGSITVEE